MDKFEYFRELYFNELNRWEDSLKSLYHPTTMLIVLIAALFYLVTNYDYDPFDVLAKLFSITVLITGILIIVVFYYLFKAYTGFKGYEYEILPLATKLKKYLDDLKKYYSDKEMTEDYMEIFEEEITDLHAGITAFNTESIIRRSILRYITIKLEFFTTLFLFLSAILFIIDYFSLLLSPG